MAEVSILNGYIIKDKKAIRFYDTVADMKADTTLKENMHIKTSGYYTKNDGGYAEYKIVNDDTLNEDGGLIHNLNNGLKACLLINQEINFEIFGAKGDSTTDDTIAIQKAINSGFPIKSTEGKTYLLTDDIDIKNNVIDLNNSILKSTLGVALNISNQTNILKIENGKFDNVCIIDDTEHSNDQYYDNCNFYNTDIDGIRVNNVNIIRVNNCIFNDIGKGQININSHGIGIRVDHSNFVQVQNSIFTYCHGTGAVVIRNTKEMYITNNYFDNNDYRAIVPADDSSEFKTSGLIDNNTINNCGVNANHNTGVGCNGIYSNCTGDLTDLVVRGNHITNVCENGIEGTFGIVENNYIDGTGVDQTNHPTPSASGINMYGGIYRNNIIKNSYLNGMYVSGNSHTTDTNLKNKKIYGNNVGKCISDPTNAIRCIGTSYENIEIYDNLCDGTIEMGTSSTYKNCAIYNNINKQDKPYKSTVAPIYLEDKGAIKYSGFKIENNVITNITTAGVTTTIDANNSVEFTSTRENGAFSIESDCNKNTINVLKIIANDNTDNIKVAVYGINDDDTQQTIASNRNINITNKRGGIYTYTENYKKIKYAIYVGDTNDTLNLKNLQTKEITY